MRALEIWIRATTRQALSESTEPIPDDAPALIDAVVQYDDGMFHDVYGSLKFGRGATSSLVRARTMAYRFNS